MSNDYSFLQVKKCELKNVDGIYTSTDGGERFTKDNFVMLRNSTSGLWNVFEVVNEKSYKICFAARSGHDVSLVAWKIRTIQGDQNSAMKVTVSTKSPMQTRSSSSASLPVGSNSNKMNTYESSNVYSSATSFISRIGTT